VSLPRCALALSILVAGLASAADPPPLPKPDKDGWIALFDGKTLAGWKASDFHGGAKVHVKDTTIVMDAGDPMTGVTYARDDFPRVDYEITFEAKKVSGDDFFCTTTFPVVDDYCSLVVGGWGGTVVGLSSLNGEDASSNRTATSKEFAANQWYRVRLRVTKDRIEGWVGDEKLVDADVSDDRLSIRIECNPSRPFGVATYRTTGALRDVRLRKLTEADKKAIAATKPGK
jgi:hypothetical protein